MISIDEEKVLAHRVRVIAASFIVVAVFILIRLMYIQLIRHDYYVTLANAEHSRKYLIPANRGKIYLTDRGGEIPVVFNTNASILYVDSRFVKDPSNTAKKLAGILGGDAKEYQSTIESGGAYVVLNENVDTDKASAIESLELSGVGLGDSTKREYSEGSLAAHVLGFVNNDGEGQYGIEQYFDNFLAGTPGQLNAKTDTRGIPIATNDNVQITPIDGGDIILTVDRNLQAKVETVLKEGTKKYGARSSSAVVINPNTGAILAMANYPTFEPEKYSTSDINLFSNTAVSNQFEPGSGFKSFSMATGIDTGSITANTTYFDTGVERIDGFSIRNAIEMGGRHVNMTSVITNSINTGVIFVLKQLGGGSINDKAKNILHTYYRDKFGFGNKTGIELPNEAEGYIPSPSEASNVAYANMTFGQGLTANMVQIVSAYSALVNGGTIYKPYIVREKRSNFGTIEYTESHAVDENIVSHDTSKTLKTMMETVVEEGGGYGTKIDGYRIGGKTGTAQIPDPQGGYFLDKDIGSFLGFAPFENPKIVMFIRIDRPTQAPGFAGSAAAGPMFGEIMDWYLKYYGIPPDAN
jgi:cell division protein FtsI (penicillin-binding protein 3)